MGKNLRSYTIDDEVINALKNIGNASGLINDLLIEHFFGSTSNNIDKLMKAKAKIREEIEEREHKLSEITAKIQGLEATEEKKEEVLKEVPQSIIADFVKFPGIDEHALMNRWEGMYKDKYKITWEELLKAFKEFKNE